MIGNEREQRIGFLLKDINYHSHILILYVHKIASVTFKLISSESDLILCQLCCGFETALVHLNSDMWYLVKQLSSSGVKKLRCRLVMQRSVQLLT